MTRTPGLGTVAGGALARLAAAVVAVVVGAVVAAPLTAQAPSATVILERVDANQASATKASTWQMTIKGRRGSRTVTARSWVQGTDRAFTEYLEPARDAGTKMLKIGGQLWTFSPATDRTIQIAGHMLRQSVMGSDMSYEDLMEDPRLVKLYDAVVDREEPFRDRPCWVIRLTAKPDAAPAYQARTLWVDRDRYLVLKEERFATSGKLLKTAEVTRAVQVQKRWIAEHSVFRDALRADGSGTEFVVSAMEFDAKVPEQLFSQASLRK